MDSTSFTLSSCDFLTILSVAVLSTTVVWWVVNRMSSLRR